MNDKFLNSTTKDKFDLKENTKLKEKFWVSKTQSNITT